MVSRFDDIATSLTDKENLSNENNQSLLFAGLTDDERQQLCPLRPYFVQKDVIGSDPPDHTRVRALVEKAFTPKTILGLKPRICELAESMVVAHAGRGRQLDLTRDELLATCNTILTAGHETAIKPSGSLVHLLLTHPEQWAVLKANPALISSAIEEAPRYEAPKQRNFRCVKKTHVFNGGEFAENEMVCQFMGAVDRDSPTSRILSP